jgi:hypothetical protein
MRVGLEVELPLSQTYSNTNNFGLRTLRRTAAHRESGLSRSQQPHGSIRRGTTELFAVR